ncbi:MAG: hypothetical protein AAB296_06520 [Candidatus Desantisbacteria bacterium]
MCLILDTNSLAATLNPKDLRHADFLPVYNWIVNGKGKIVYGGSQIKKEYKACQKYFRMLMNLEKRNKIVLLCDTAVDREQKILKDKKSHRDFNDSHLLAMVIVSGVRIVCTAESRAIPFLKDRNLYPAPIKKPKIYSKANNSTLLIDSNIARICMPCVEKKSIITFHKGDTKHA